MPLLHAMCHGNRDLLVEVAGTDDRVMYKIKAGSADIRSFPVDGKEFTVKMTNESGKWDDVHAAFELRQE